MSNDGKLIEELMGSLAKTAKKPTYNTLKPKTSDKSNPVSSFIQEIEKENKKETEKFEKEEKKLKDKKKK